MRKYKVLIIDDEKLIRWSLEKQISKLGYEAISAESGEEGLKLFKSHLPDIVFLDNKLPGIQGSELIQQLNQLYKKAIIIFMTAHGSIDIAVDAMKSGAGEYLVKPFNPNDIKELLIKITNTLNEEKINKKKTKSSQNEINFDSIVGSSLIIQKLISQAKIIANTEATNVLILGESGTGKDLFAKAIHFESNRKNKPFIDINCAVLPNTLLESELFGYEKGAFTDAKSQKKGLFEIATGGSVFLDEIGEIDHSTQVKLLGVLENRKIRRVGGVSDIPIEVRIIAATNKDLKKAIENKTFREDLYYRLQVFQITMPPLRNHKEDIPELIDHFIKVFNTRFDKSIEGISKETKFALMQYNWPGNIRELRNVIERAVILESSNIIQVDSLPFEISTEKISDKFTDKIDTNENSLYEIEKQVIEKAIIDANYNQSEAARYLGISRDTLRYRIKKYNINIS